MNQNINKFIKMSDDYEKFRPSYSNDAINYTLQLYKNKNLTIADIGAGTGKLSKQFLDKGNTLYCIEPNYEMFEKINKTLNGYNNIHILNSAAENTELPNNSIDLITIGQAFHRFDTIKFKQECKRILKNSSDYIAIFYNNGDHEKQLPNEISDLSKKYCPSYKGSSGGLSNNEGIFEKFFKEYEKIKFKNNLILDREQFIGLNLSASYAPKQNDNIYEEYLENLNIIFNRYEQNNKIILPNYTILRIGKI